MLTLCVVLPFWTSRYGKSVRLTDCDSFNGVPLWIAPQKKATPGAARRRRTFVLQLRITTPHYGRLILQMAVYDL